ncbi:MAG: amino acid permease, partial [Ferruginibacter sp.]
TKYGLRFIVFTTFAKLIPLLLLIGFGTGHISLANLHWKYALTFNNVGSASLLLIFAFCGIETAVTNSGEFKNPSRTVPLGILSGLSFVVLLYIAIQLVSQGVLGDGLIAVKDAPLAAVSNILFGSFGTTLVVAGTAVSMLGGISGEILAIPRVLFAGARDGILPKALAKVHPKYVTPHVAIAVYTGLGFLFAVFGVLKQLLILSTAATLLIYLGVVLATIKLRFKKSGSNEKGFKIPGGITVPILATVTIIWLLSHLSKQEIIGSSIFIVALAVIYFLMSKFKNKKIQLATQKKDNL